MLPKAMTRYSAPLLWGTLRLEGFADDPWPGSRCVSCQPALAGQRNVSAGCDCTEAVRTIEGCKFMACLHFPAFFAVTSTLA
jgi:hypothetical protein